MVSRQNHPTALAIRKAASKLFAEQGLELTSVAHIRKQAGVSSGSFFHFFATKTAVAEAVCLDALESYRATLILPFEAKAPDPQDTIRAAVNAQVTWIDGHRQSAHVLARLSSILWSDGPAGGVCLAWTSLSDAIADWADPWIRAGKLKKLPPKAMVAILVGPVLTLFLGSARGDEDTHLVDFAADLSDAIWAAVAAPTPVKPAKPAKGAQRQADPDQHSLGFAPNLPPEPPGHPDLKGGG